MALKEMLAIFDYSDSLEDEIEIYEFQLERIGIDYKKVKLSDNVNLIEEGDYDILFFDWGGMSMGNSMLEHFCDRILKKARECPDKHFVMLSMFTKDAMRDAKNELDKEIEEVPYNIFLGIEEYGTWKKKYEGKAREF